MKSVWILQDYDSMHILAAFTTRKGAIERAKELQKRKLYMDKQGYLYAKDPEEIIYIIEKIPLVKNTREVKR